MALWVKRRPRTLDSAVLMVTELYPTTSKIMVVVVTILAMLVLWSGWFGIKYRLVGLVERRLPRDRKIPSSNPACAGIFSGSSHTSDSKICTPALGLVGLVSVYCDWMR